MRDRHYDEAVAETFRQDPDLALDLLKDILEDGTLDEFIVILRQLSVAFGTGAQRSSHIPVNAQTNNHPAISRNHTLSAMLHPLGMRLTVQPLHQP